MPRKLKPKPVVIDNHKFPSQLEGNRYKFLKLLQRAGQITELELQPKFEIVINGYNVCTYTADFSYYDMTNSRKIYEDAKGYLRKSQRLYILLAQAVHNVQINLVYFSRRIGWHTRNIKCKKQKITSQ